MSDKRDYYEVLDVERTATEKDLKNAFRRLARKYHPDRSEEEDAENKFKEIQEAYAVLSDSDKRAHYDRFGHDSPGGNPFGGFSGGGFNINLEDLLGGDFFSGFFGGGGGGGGGRRRDRRGSDILVRHSIDLTTVISGSDESIELDLPSECIVCSGTGAKGGSTTTCNACQGQGRVRVRQQIGPFVNEVVQDCRECAGVGSTIDSKCQDCSGLGHKVESKTIRFSVPPGAEDGTRLRLRGQGQPAERGQGKTGDLLVEIEVLTHPWFERNGSDLIMSLPLGYPDLVLGTTITLDHIDGKTMDIVIPAKSSAGHTLEIKKRGLPRLRRNGRGDVIVLLKLHMPKSISKAEKKQLKAMKEGLNPNDQLQTILDDAADRRVNG
uniref:Chaperone protein DnaJ n=1 Tax=uncultured marine group II euryarchaeote 37F11 TaxID=133822 RepID=Q9P9B5_9ARCH|nr:DnaJ [uncultured marine group II euryarchaeote 37F11]